MKIRTLHGRHPLRARSNKGSRLLIASGLSLGGMLTGLQAQAQQTGATEPAAAAAPAAAASAAKASEPPSSLETVVVTARKTSERLQDVPLSVTAIQAKTLEDAGIKNIQDVAKLTPGITVNAAGAESNLSVTIRGLTNLNAGSSDPNVAIFLDGVYLANPSAVSLGLIDMERVEVIKGPVSALYGRNAYGGVINYVSKKPFKTFEGSAAVTLGNAGGRTAQASISGPISPILLARLTFGQDQSDGTYKDAVNGLRVGGFKKKDVMGSFTFTPSKELTATGSIYVGDDFFDNPAAAYLDNNCGPKSAVPVSAGEFTQYCGNLNYKQHPIEVAALSPNAGASGNHRRVLSANLKVSYDFGIADASTLFGYNKVTQQRFADFTGHRDGIPFQTSTGTTNLKELFGSDANNTDSSIEFRVASKQNQPLRWAGGYYFFSANSTASTLIGIDGSPLKPGQTLTGALAGTQNFFLTPDGSFSKTNLTLTGNTDRVLSPFASIEYDVLPALTGALEVRHTKESKTIDIIRNSFVPNTVEPFGPQPGADYSFSNARGSIRYKLNSEAMVYTSAANGTKAGGLNQRATIPSEVPFGPEKNTTLELGGKASFMERRLQMGFALFHIKTSNMQISGPSDDPKNTGLVTKNFGGSTSNGFELDLAAVPVRGLTVNAGVGYSNPKFSSGTYDFSNAGPCATIPSCAGRVVTVNSASGPKQAVDLSGLQVPRASTLTGTLGVQYNGRISDEWGWFARGDFRYESKQYSTQTNFNYWGARKVVNLHGGVSNDRYSLTAFVNNLTNDTTPETVTANTRLNDFVANQVAYLPAKRTFGVTVAVQF